MRDKVRAGLGPPQPELALLSEASTPHPCPAVRGGSWQGGKDTNQIPDLSSFLPRKAGTWTKGCRKSKPLGHPAWPGACGLHSQGVPVATSVPLQFNCDPLRGLHAEWDSTHVGPHHQGRALVLGRGRRVFLGVQDDTLCPGPDTPLTDTPLGPALCGRTKHAQQAFKFLRFPHVNHRDRSGHGVS